MLNLLPLTYGNRRPDAYGNVHILWDDHGLPVFRDPGDYTGSHRAGQPNALLRLLARLCGENV